jgi:flagellar motor switch protein FliG
MNVLSDFLDRVEEQCKDSFVDTVKEKAESLFGSAKEKAKKSGEKSKQKTKAKWDEVKKYTLEDIVDMSNNKVKEFLRQIKTTDLAHAMKETSDDVREKIIPNMTKKMKKEFESLQKEIKRVKRADLKKFRNRIEEELNKIKI